MAATGTPASIHPAKRAKSYTRVPATPAAVLTNWVPTLDQDALGSAMEAQGLVHERSINANARRLSGDEADASFELEQTAGQVTIVKGDYTANALLGHAY